MFPAFGGRTEGLSFPVPERVMPLPLLMKTSEAAGETASTDQASLFDAALVVRMAAGDQAALATLFERYSRIVLGIAYRVLRDRGESEELVQDVFLYVHRNATRHNPNRGSVKAWIVQLSYYRALNRRLFLARRRFYDGTDLEGIENNVLGKDDPEGELLSAVAALSRH